MNGRNCCLYLCVCALLCSSYGSTVPASRKNGAGFTWRTCGDDDDSIRITKLDVHRDGKDYFYVTAAGEVRENVTSPVVGRVEMRKKIAWFWMTVPCVSNFGSCAYEDVCSLSPYDSECPDFYEDRHLFCKCPVLQGSYAVENIPVRTNLIPHWLEKGEYDVKIRLYSERRRLLCLKIYALIP